MRYVGMRYGTRPAVFVDKDDTLVEDVPYSVAVDAIRFAPGACEALGLLAEAGFGLVLVTNQSGVARGLFGEEEVRGYLRTLARMLAREGVLLADARYCPHHPDAAVARYRAECACRKPQPGMILDSARDLGIDLTRSWMVGDLLDDVEAGARAGCATALVDVHADQRPPDDGLRRPDIIVASLTQAAEHIAELAGVAA